VPQYNIDLGADTTMCYGNSLILGGNIVADSYVWSTGEEVNTISVNTSGSYFVTVKKNTCEISDTINVIFRPQAVFGINYPKGICLRDSVRLNASGGHIYNWQNLPGLSN